MDIDTGDVHDYAHTHTYIAWILIQEMYMTQNTIDTRERQLSIYTHTHTYIAWILIQDMYMTQRTQ